MAPSHLPTLSLLFFFLLLLTNSFLSQAQFEHATDWPTSLSMYADNNDCEADTIVAGRSLLWWNRMRYYISYGALSANRIPCPARSGRSYYTHNCYKARGPAHPYTRGCSAIARCRR